MPRPLTVKVSTDRPSKASEMPPGIHQVPDTSVYIAGFQGESMKVGMHFGLIGMLAADAAASTAGPLATARAARRRRRGVAHRHRADASRRVRWTAADGTRRAGSDVNDVLPKYLGVIKPVLVGKPEFLKRKDVDVSQEVMLVAPILQNP